jgi:hypothetical protein
MAEVIARKERSAGTTQQTTEGVATQGIVPILRCCEREKRWHENTQHSARRWKDIQKCLQPKQMLSSGIRSLTLKCHHETIMCMYGGDYVPTQAMNLERRMLTVYTSLGLVSEVSKRPQYDTTWWRCDYYRACLDAPYCGVRCAADGARTPHDRNSPTKQLRHVSTINDIVNWISQRDWWFHQGIICYAAQKDWRS